MRILTALLSLYSLLVLFRILLTWFRGVDLGRAEEYLARLTDPYINWFRRFSFLKIGQFDFSVIGALIALSILTSITSQLAITASITVGIILAIIVARVASAIGFFLTIFLVIALIRLGGELFGANTANRFWIVLDQIIEPLVHSLGYKLARGRIMNYQNALIIFAGVLLLILVAGRLLLPVITAALVGLPF